MFELLLGCSQKEVSMLGLASETLAYALYICQLYVHEQKKTHSSLRSPQMCEYLLVKK